jgi:HAD superfamily hydrolase (TIGR01509 family)
MNYLPELFQPEQIRLFDGTVLSYQTNFVKPMLEAYQAAADSLGVTVEECVFIDDQERFVTGAREAGMPAIWYKDNQQLRADLECTLADSKI